MDAKTAGRWGKVRTVGRRAPQVTLLLQRGPVQELDSVVAQRPAIDLHTLS